MTESWVSKESGLDSENSGQPLKSKSKGCAYSIYFYACGRLVIFLSLGEVAQCRCPVYPCSALPLSLKLYSLGAPLEGCMNLSFVAGYVGGMVGLVGS